MNAREAGHRMLVEAEHDDAELGRRMHGLCTRLYPILRSITGDGVRQTLRVIGDEIPITVGEVPSGTPIFDWEVPDEWNIREAWVEDPSGRRVIDLVDHSLHVVNYSEPVDRRMSLDELQKHLHSMPDRPDWIPYRTSYFARTWGFCLAHSMREKLLPGEYRARIDSTLAPGALTWGECFIPGESTDEVLIQAHVCHPSLANDNLSGISVAAALASGLSRSRPRLSYRFLFAPSTVGIITWLATQREKLAKVVAGLVISGVGDSGPFSYKKSRRGDASIDRVMRRALAGAGRDHVIEDFSPYGYDERQFCSPGFNLPVGCLMRTPYGQYPEYHTSGDNLDFLNPGSLVRAYHVIRAAFEELGHVGRYRNLSPYCEPQLGRRGLYENLGGENERRANQMAILWMLNFSDGAHSTLDIAERSGIPIANLGWAAERLCEAGLLEPIAQSRT